MDINKWLPKKHQNLAGQLVRFGISTGFSAACSVLIPVILHEGFGVDERTAVAIGFTIAYIGNMLLVRAFVFKSVNNIKHDIPRYIVVNGLFRLAEYAAFLALLTWAPFTYLTSLLVILSVSAVIKFCAYRKLFDR
jgi:putative flippase GtrA